VALYVEHAVLAALADSARLDFAFGSFGRCRLRLEPGA